MIHLYISKIKWDKKIPNDEKNKIILRMERNEFSST